MSEEEEHEPGDKAAWLSSFREHLHAAATDTEAKFKDLFGVAVADVEKLAGKADEEMKELGHEAASPERDAKIHHFIDEVKAHQKQVEEVLEQHIHHLGQVITHATSLLTDHHKHEDDAEEADG